MELSFFNRVIKKEVINLEFFNEEAGDLQLSCEHKFLEKWIETINNQIKSYKKFIVL
jgi:hypothetical protein